MVYTRTIIASILFLFSSLATSQPTVELVWSDTTGNGTTGSNTINAKVGDELTLDILVSGDARGLLFAKLSLTWFGDVLTGFDAEECPSPPNETPGFCIDENDEIGFPATFIPLVPGAVIDEFSRANSFDVIYDLLPIPAFESEAMFLGRIKFLVDANFDFANEVSVEVYYEDDEMIVDGGYGESQPTATATIKKPPGCG